MSDETNTILDIDTTKVALAVGHVAALALVAQLRDGSPDELQLYYRMFEPLEEGRDCEDDLAIMADYISKRPGDVYGEQLYRKASELALHNAPSNGYDEQPFVIREAYRLFAKSCRMVAVDLTISKRQEQERLTKTARKRNPIAPEDQTYAPDEPADALDPVRAAALKAMREMPKVKAPIGDETANDAGTGPDQQLDNQSDPSSELALSIGGEPEDNAASDPQSQTDPDGDIDGEASVLSIGERPVAHQGKPQRGGARNNQ